MKCRISSLTHIVLEPESDLEKLVMQEWSSSGLVCDFCIHNAGLDFPTRYLTAGISFRTKADEKRVPLPAAAGRAEE